MRVLALIGVVVCLTASSVSAQLAYYIDERGRKIYINPEPKPAAKAKAPAAATKKPAAVLPQPQVLPSAKSGPSPFAPPPGLATAIMPPAISAPLQPKTPPPSVDTVIQDAAKRHDMDPQLVKAVVQVESNFNPGAVSSKGAMGLMQLIPGTARRFGVGNVFNPVENVDGGVRYLKYLLTLYGGNRKLALAAYNAGEGAVQRHGGVPPYRETQNYVKKISDVYSVLHPPQVPIDPTRILRTMDASGRVLYTNMP